MKIIYCINRLKDVGITDQASLLSVRELERLGHDVYCVDWVNISSELKADYLVHSLSGKEYSNVDINDYSDVIFYRSIGSVESRIFSFQHHLIDLKERYHGIVFNPVDAMLYGVRKDYLVFLEKNGFPVIPTKIFSNNVNLDFLIENRFNDNISQNIIKPVTGECGNSFFTLDQVTNSILEYKNTKVGGWILQPVVPEVLSGEISLIMINGKPSHAVKKIPPQGQYRVNQRWVSQVLEIPIDNNLVELAVKIRNFWPFELPIFRLDVIQRKDGGFYIMEVETVNPSFFQNYLKNPELPIQLIVKNLLK